MNEQPNFNDYSYEQLLDVEKRINKEKFPERHSSVVALIADPSHLEEQKHAFLAQLKAEKYSTFWFRLIAAAIDCAIVALLFRVEALLFGFDVESNGDYLPLLMLSQLYLYTILMHGISGKTVGKILMKIKVVNFSDEKKIGVAQAFKRELVNLLLLALWINVLTLELVDATFELNMLNIIQALVIATLIANYLWMLGEFVTMLLNEKRRSLHDFIGKTVVIRAIN